MENFFHGNYDKKFNIKHCFNGGQSTFRER